MKNSLFNIFIDHGDVILGYNTLYDKGISVKKSHFNVTSDMLQQNLLDTLGKHQKAIKVLVNNKFIIDDYVDELQIVKQYLDSENDNDSLYEIIINPTINCNFHCWYCYETHVAGTKMSSEMVNSIIRLIKDIIDKNNNLKNIKIYWFGGEPLIYFKDVIEPILSEANSYIKNRNINFISGFTTNGYLLNEKILDFCVAHSVTHFQITIDGNRERHNMIRYPILGTNTYDKIVSNIILCIKKGLAVTVRLNISFETKLNVNELLQDFTILTTFERKRIRFSIHKVWQENNSVYDEIDRIVNEIRNNGFECVTFFSDPNTIRKTCYADKKNSVVINYDGIVFKCTARDYTEEQQEGRLQTDGTIVWNDYHEKREKLSVLNYKHCITCPIMPICNAGCSQKKIEHSGTFCLYQSIKEKQAFAEKVLLEKIYRNKKMEVQKSI